MAVADSRQAFLSGLQPALTANDRDCAICYGAMTFPTGPQIQSTNPHVCSEAVIIHDNHVLGRACITKNVVEYWDRECPLCRRKLFPDNDLPLSTRRAIAGLPEAARGPSLTERTMLLDVRDDLWQDYEDNIARTEGDEDHLDDVMWTIRQTLVRRMTYFARLAPAIQQAISGIYPDYPAEYANINASDLPDEIVPIDASKLVTELIGWFDTRSLDAWDVAGEDTNDMRHHPLAPAYYYAAVDILLQWAHGPAHSQASPQTLYMRLMSRGRGAVEGPLQRLSGWVHDICMAVALTAAGRRG